MKIVTDRISPDELCWGLKEEDRYITASDGKASLHRVQCVYVLRGDSIAEYTTDLGPASRWHGVPGLKLLTTAGPNDTPEDRVGEVMEEAERSRGDAFERDLRAHVVGESTLIRDYWQEKEENRKRIANQSHFGPRYTKQRNGFSRPF